MSGRALVGGWFAMVVLTIVAPAPIGAMAAVAWIGYFLIGLGHEA